jgi:RNAse (barnase) inhibitor barstar
VWAWAAIICLLLAGLVHLFGPILPVRRLTHNSAEKQFWMLLVFSGVFFWVHGMVTWRARSGRRHQLPKQPPGFPVTLMVDETPKNPAGKTPLTFTLDGRLLTSQAAFWEQYVRVVQPFHGEGFGRNLDALEDALDGGPGWPGENVRLRIEHSANALRHLDAEFVAALREICEGRMELEWV